MREKETAEKIAFLVSEAGGCAYYVGGYVRDRMLGIESKDIDIEIHGIEEKRLAEVLSDAGRIYSKGAGFSVYGISGCDLDIALPRRESKNGRGHRGFDVFSDPYIGEKKACLRRDFTVNAMMENVLTGDILDYCGGLDDLEKGIIRHVSSMSFSDDPLRVIRMAAFCARLGFEPAEETLRLSESADISELPRERIEGELMKVLTGSERPSVFFEILKRIRKLSFWFPEIEALSGIPQNPEHHPEGDVWNHTMMVLDEASKLRADAWYPEGFMMAALMHDIGKSVTTFTGEDGRIRSIGHEKCLEEVRRAMHRITGEKKLISYVVNMTALHMRPNQLAKFNSGQKAINRLFDSSCSPRDLILLSKADFLGRADAPDYAPTEEYLHRGYDSFCSIMDKPYVKGEDLIAAGITPGPEMGKLLKSAHSMRLAGMNRDKVLKELGISDNGKGH